MSNGQKYTSWIASVIAIVIIGMAIPGKFTGDSAMVFEALGAEPWGRYLAGVLEVAAVVGLLWGFVNRKAAAVGGIVGAVVMAGAIGAHVMTLGFEGQAGTMAAMAGVALVASLVVVFLNRDALTGGSGDAAEAAAAAE